MFSFRRFLTHFVVLSSLLVAVSTADAFVVQRIQFVGLQRISTSSARSYLPIKIGQQLKQSQVSKVIKALYNTGFFVDS